MNAFKEACKVEDRSWAILKHFIAAHSMEGRFVTTNKGRLARQLQKTIGDVLANNKKNEIIAIELKTEESNKYGNLFIETWSNKSRFTLGWIYTLSTDVIMYHFLLEDELYLISFERLRNWLFSNDNNHPNIDKYPELKQAKYDQLNDTWGRCIPIKDLMDNVGVTLHRPEKYVLEETRRGWLSSQPGAGGG